MPNRIQQHYHLINLLHSFLLLAAMFLLLALIGWLVAGFAGLLWSLAVCIFLLIIIPGSSSRFILYLYGARPFSANQLTAALDWLASESHLAQTPRLYFLPVRSNLAFSLGLKNDKSIAISYGMLRTLNFRELTAVLAHEVSHIQSKDLWVMAVANIINHVTGLMALFGYLLILFYFPILITQKQNIPWLLLLVLVFAPSISAILQLALSRTREFNADSNAVKLTGDTQGLISALIKMENYENSWLNQLLHPGLRIPLPSLFRTHPMTEERIHRLQEIDNH